MTKLQQIIDHFLNLKNLHWREVKYGRYCKPAQELLILCDGDVEKAKEVLTSLKADMEKNGLEWEFSTLFRRPDILKKLV